MEEQGKLELGDLFSELDKNNKQQIPQFIHTVNKSRSKKIQKISKKRHQELKRQQNYNLTKQQLDKWLPIVKSNRQKDTLNFQPKQETIGNTVNYFPSKPMNDFHKKIDNKLAQMNTSSEKQIIKHQQSILEKVDPEQAKRRLIQARKHRTAIFYEEQKNRRISKIKSKLYRRIKKKQRMRQQAKKVESMGPSERQQYVEKLTKNRIKQRITLRHKTKNKHIQNLLRFGKNQKQTIQKQINEVNQLRKKQLQKINQQMIDEISEEYDDQNFRQDAIKDLQAQIQMIEKQQENRQDTKQDGLTDLKFIQLARQKRKNQEKKVAKQLLRKLQKKGDFQEEDLDSSQEIEEQSVVSNGQNGRRTYGKNIQGGKIIQTKQKQKTIQDKLNHHLRNHTNEELIEGIDLDKLKQKYQPQRVQLDLADLIANNKEIYEGTNQAALQNVREFQQEKVMNYESQIEPEKQKLKGWGSWAGPGIQERKIDPKIQLRKKLQKIQQLKKNRKDSALAHVTINQSRNKNLSNYLVKNLPHHYSNADQFDYMQNQPIGPQWNSFNQFKDNIKPKVITKTGKVITAAKLPKKIEKLSHGAGYGAQK